MKRVFKSIFFVFFLFIGFFSTLSAKELPDDLIMFEKSYPDITFKEKYDDKLDDWKLELSMPTRPGSKKRKSAVFYWADSRMLPKDEYENIEKYTPLLYEYDQNLRDPKTFTKQEKEEIKKYSSESNRKAGPGAATFFFDFVYSADSKEELIKHTTGVFFLSKETRIHERIKKPLKRVESKILAYAKTDTAVKAFISNLKSTDAYHWRIIAGTKRKSFHTYGIAIDVLPKKRGNKEIFWSWTKENVGDKWIMTKLSARWMPPKKVIKAFESEGFIWGGKWVIWDNMHFEYRPELIKYNNIN